MFDHRLFIFNLNLSLDLRGQLLLKYKVKFNNFGLFLIVSFLFIFELLDLDIIWSVNLMILIKVSISGFFLSLIFNKS